MSRCDSYQELISRMLDEPLGEEEQADLTAHLRQCESCAAFYSAMSAVSAGIRSDLEEPPEELHENIMAEIRRSEIKKQNKLHPILRVALTAAACLAVVAAVSLFSPKGRTQMAASAIGSKAVATQTNSADEAAPAEAPAEMAEEAAPETYLEEPKSDASDALLELNVSLDRAALLERLGAEPCEVPQGLQPETLFAVLTVGDGETFSVYRMDGKLYVEAPETGEVFLCACAPEELATLAG